MALNNMLKMVAASFVFSAAVFANDAANASQHVVANTVEGGSIDMGKVQEYKLLFSQPQDTSALEGVAKARAEVNWTEVFDSAFTWTDVVEGVSAAFICSTSCYACPAGCSVVCCTGSGNITLAAPDWSGTGGDDSPMTSKPDPKTPDIFRPRPIPPLACPCNCQASCPRKITTICCFTPGVRLPPHDGDSGDEDQDEKDEQKPTLDARERFWGRAPPSPFVCPCNCEASCPAYIQAICCFTPGSDRAVDGADGDADSDSSTSNQTSKPPHRDILSLVLETVNGDPVSALAAVNLAVEQSFVTLDLVQGLERGDEITYSDDRQVFEIVLPVVAGPSHSRRVDRQSFQVIDGSKLLEREQILLGLGFMARINCLAVRHDLLAGLDAGLPVMTGTRA